MFHNFCLDSDVFDSCALTATPSQAIMLVQSHSMFLKGLVNPTLKQMKYLSSDNPVITLALKKKKQKTKSSSFHSFRKTMIRSKVKTGKNQGTMVRRSSCNFYKIKPLHSGKFLKESSKIFRLDSKIYESQVSTGNAPNLKTT